MMSFYDLRLDYALDGNSNYIDWKERMDAVLEDNGLKEFIDNDMVSRSLQHLMLKI